MARIRSPNYPGMSLPEAISKIKTLHKREQHLSAPREVMAKHLGYAGINGASLKALSALLKYGLLEKTKDGQRRVTELAIKILHPHEEDEKASAIREAALRPTLFSEIAKQWPDGTPSDENLKVYLIRRNFASDAIPEVIKAYRETAELVTPESSEYDSAQGVEKEPIMEPIHFGDRVPPEKGAGAAHLQPECSNELNKPQIIDLGDMIQVNGLVDRKGLDRLIKKLNAYKAVLDASFDDEDEDR
jgi:hypothetical protein